MTPAVVLFDLDGTLLLTGGASSRCILKAGQAIFGSRFHLGKITLGTLDPEIVMELASQCGIENAAASLEAYKARYLQELTDDLARTRGARTLSVKALPGIRKLLAALSSRTDVVVGLLTGNYRDGAMAKLGAADIDSAQFVVGAFAEDGLKRSDLVGVALRRVRERTGMPCTARNVIIVGDTPRDIACARDTGCRVLAVATGRYGLAELLACGPDVGVADLSDAAPLWKLILEAADAA